MNRIISPYAIASPAVRRQKAFTKMDLFKTKFILKLLILIGFTVMLSLFYVWSRIQIVQMGYDINRTKQIQTELTEENKLYRMELAARQSPEMLKNLAQTRFKMNLPDKKKIHTLSISHE